MLLPRFFLAHYTCGLQFFSYVSCTYVVIYRYLDLVFFKIFGDLNFHIIFINLVKLMARIHKTTDILNGERKTNPQCDCLRFTKDHGLVMSVRTTMIEHHLKYHELICDGIGFSSSVPSQSQNLHHPELDAISRRCGPVLTVSCQRSGRPS